MLSSPLTDVILSVVVVILVVVSSVVVTSAAIVVVSGVTEVTAPCVVTVVSGCVDVLKLVVADSDVVAVVVVADSDVIAVVVVAGSGIVALVVLADSDVAVTVVVPTVVVVATCVVVAGVVDRATRPASTPGGIQSVRALPSWYTSRHEALAGWGADALFEKLKEEYALLSLAAVNNKHDKIRYFFVLSFTRVMI